MSLIGNFAPIMTVPGNHERDCAHASSSPTVSHHCQYHAWVRFFSPGLHAPPCRVLRDY